MKTMFKRTLAILLCVLLLGTAAFGVCAENAGPSETDVSGSIPDIEIVNYKKVMFVPGGTKLVFHTTADAPEGYRIAWSNGDAGPECIINSADKMQYEICADLVRIEDGEVVRSTQTESVYTLNGLLVQGIVGWVLAWYHAIFNMLPGGLGGYVVYMLCNDNHLSVEKEFRSFFDDQLS